MRRNPKKDLLELIKVCEPDGEFWSARGRRTNLFLGSKPHGEEKKYDRFRSDGLAACLISQLFEKWYLPTGFKIDESAVEDPSQKRWRDHLGNCCHFECLRYDCMFLEDKDLERAYGFPESWKNDWLIEVENDFHGELVMTLIGLLDVVCDDRLAIFFVDDPDLDQMNKRFSGPWKAHVKPYPFMRDFNLQVLLFPNTFSSFAKFSERTLLVDWDAYSQQFVLLNS